MELKTLVLLHPSLDLYNINEIFIHYMNLTELV